jgi:AcrR family transcriptional regulator
MSTLHLEQLKTINPKDDSNTRIINAAIYLFALQSYKNTSTKSIAEHAGVSEALLFKQFQNKHNLLKKVITELIRNRIPSVLNMYLNELMTRQIEVHTLEEIRNIIFLKVKEINHHIAYFKIIFFEISELDQETINTLKTVINEIISKVCLLIDQLKEVGIIKSQLDSRLIFRSFIGMTNFMLIDKSLLNDGLDIEKEFNSIFDLFTKGVLHE